LTKTSSILKAPLSILSAYNDAVAMNFGGTTPLQERVTFLFFLILAGVAISWFAKITLDTTGVQNVIAVHGIFLSVLVASYGQFLDFSDKNLLSKPPESDPLDGQASFEAAKQIVKRLLFASNSLCVFLCLAIIVLAGFASGVEKTTQPNWLFEYCSEGLFERAYYAILFSMMTLNVLVVFRTITIVSTIAFGDDD